jgi:hypothetical protein
MTYTPAVAPDITGTFPGGVVPLATDEGPAGYHPTGVRFDVAIGGVPFMLTASSNTPYVRQTAPIQKPQFDVSAQAGEQTLDQYWIRSQVSWHRGAGVKFYEPASSTSANRFWEPGAELITEDRYESSAGVDVWTREQATLLYRTSLVGASAGLAYVTTGKLADNTDVVFTNEAGVVKRRTAAGAATSYTDGTTLLVRTNLVANPSFEADTVGWMGTIARQAGGYVGAYCGRSTATVVGAYNAMISPSVAATPGQVFTGSFYARGTVGNPIYIIATWVGPGTTFNASVTATASWQRVSVTGTAPAGTTGISIQMYSASAAVGDYVDFDAVLLEQSATAGAYFDGSSAGGAWTGAANASTSTQTTTVGTISGTAGTAVAVAGSKILVGRATGIDVGDANGTTMAALWTIASGATVVPYWVKGRIIASIGPSLYSLTLAVGGAIASTNIIHTHQDPNWAWSSVTEGPAAIYAAGYSGAQSSIYKFVLQDATTGTLPTLGQAYEVGVMPTGEQVFAIRSYLGGYLALGTTLGVRVALMDINGNINYGPLVVETTNPVTSVEGHGSFIYATIQEGIDGFTGAVRVNLGQPLPHEDLRFAYAMDAQTHDNGVPSSIAFFGTTDRVALGVTGKGVYAQSATQLEATGYIMSGRIRYKTAEKKAFRLADLRTRIPAGTVALSALDENASEVNLITLGSNATDGTSIGLTQPAGNHEYLQFRTTLTCSGDGLTGPTLQSLQIKALPAPKRQRLIQYPLNCGDKETDAAGVPCGVKGWAWQRVQALELAEENNVVLQCQDFTNGETFSATIEQSEFARTSPRAADASGNFTGTFKITLRKL